MPANSGPIYGLLAKHQWSHLTVIAVLSNPIERLTAEILPQCEPTRSYNGTPWEMFLSDIRLLAIDEGSHWLLGLSTDIVPYHTCRTTANTQS